MKGAILSFCSWAALTSFAIIAAMRASGRPCWNQSSLWQPKGRFPDTGSSNIAPLNLQLHDADAKIGAPDVGGDNGVVAVQHPGRRQLEAAEQASLVRMAGVIVDISMRRPCS